MPSRVAGVPLSRCSPGPRADPEARASLGGGDRAEPARSKRSTQGVGGGAAERGFRILSRKATARRIRRRTVRRWLLPTLAGVALLLALTAVVQRGEEGRRLSREVLALQGEEQIVHDRIAEQTARVDSLGSLGRLQMEADALGLRQAGDGEVTYLRDTGPESSVTADVGRDEE